MSGLAIFCRISRCGGIKKVHPVLAYFLLHARIASCMRAFVNFHGHPTFAYEINDDHCYGDLKYSWDGYKGTAENISHHKKEVLIN